MTRHKHPLGSFAAVQGMWPSGATGAAELGTKVCEIVAVLERDPLDLIPGSPRTEYDVRPLGTVRTFRVPASALLKAVDPERAARIEPEGRPASYRPAHADPEPSPAPSPEIGPDAAPIPRSGPPLPEYGVPELDRVARNAAGYRIATDATASMIRAHGPAIDPTPPPLVCPDCDGEDIDNLGDGLTAICLDGACGQHWRPHADFLWGPSNQVEWTERGRDRIWMAVTLVHREALHSAGFDLVLGDTVRIGERAWRVVASIPSFEIPETRVVLDRVGLVQELDGRFGLAAAKVTAL